MEVGIKSRIAAINNVLIVLAFALGGLKKSCN